MASVNQITRSGFDPVNVSNKEEQFIIRLDGIDLQVLYLPNGSFHSVNNIISEASLATIPDENIEIDFLNIDFSQAKLTSGQLNDALFFISQLDSSQFTGQTITTGQPLEDLDQEILLDLITKNFILEEE